MRGRLVASARTGSEGSRTLAAVHGGWSAGPGLVVSCVGGGATRSVGLSRLVFPSIAIPAQSMRGSTRVWVAGVGLRLARSRRSEHVAVGSCASSPRRELLIGFMGNDVSAEEFRPMLRWSLEVR